MTTEQLLKEYNELRKQCDSKADEVEKSIEFDQLLLQCQRCDKTDDSVKELFDLPDDDYGYDLTICKSCAEERGLGRYWEKC